MNIPFVHLLIITLSVIKISLSHVQRQHFEPGEKLDNYVEEHSKNEKDFHHKSIIGNADEAAEFDELDEAESKRRLEILLGKMDTNKDQLIDQEELKSWILRSFRMLSEEESESRMSEIDENDDGYVTWQEYQKESFDIEDEEDNPEADSEEQKLLAEDRKLFETADENGDGRLDAVEFFSFSHPEEAERMFPVLLQQTLDEKDTDNDGRISFLEYVGTRGADHGNEWLTTEKDKFNNDYDQDGNGFLSPDEIITWIAPSNDEIANDEVKHLFHSADSDNDDLLTFSEVLSNHDAFVGSEATDYGEHLHNLDRFEDEL